MGELVSLMVLSSCDMISGMVDKRKAIRHELKTIQPFYDDIASGHKTFELRRDDRDFQVGDLLWLREWSGVRFKRSMHRRIIYIMRADDQVLPASVTGLMDGHCLLGLGPA